MLRRYMPSWIKKDRTEFVLEIVSALGLAFVALRWLNSSIYLCRSPVLVIDRPDPSERHTDDS